jgi:hypothetical protein
LKSRCQALRTVNEEFNFQRIRPLSISSLFIRSDDLRSSFVFSPKTGFPQARFTLQLRHSLVWIYTRWGPFKTSVHQSSVRDRTALLWRTGERWMDLPDSRMAGLQPLEKFSSPRSHGFRVCRFPPCLACVERLSFAMYPPPVD